MPGKQAYHVIASVNGNVYTQWQSIVCYYWYKKARAVDKDGVMGGFTRLLHRCVQSVEALSCCSAAQDTWQWPRGVRVAQICLSKAEQGLCCSGRPDELMKDVPTVVVQPLPEGIDKVCYAVHCCAPFFELAAARASSLQAPPAVPLHIESKFVLHAASLKGSSMRRATWCSTGRTPSSSGRTSTWPPWRRTTCSWPSLTTSSSSLCRCGALLVVTAAACSS